MGRAVKYKKMRELSQMYKGDSEHDNAPPTTDWEVEFEQEKKKVQLREKKLQDRIQSQKLFQAKRKQESEKKALSELRIMPNESLGDFADRVNTTSRLAASAEANASKNRTRKAKLEAKREKRRADGGGGGFEGDEFDDDEENKSKGRKGKSREPRFQAKSALPRFLDVADRPPEFSTTSDKKRFRETTAGDAKQEMAALSSRVQGLYKKNRRS